MKKMNKPTILFLTACLLLASGLYAQGVVTGSKVLWYPVTITFDGPQADESKNTFFNNRMDVTFTKGSKSLKVAGFFAADGDAANTSATSGNKWRVRFTPDEAGEWTYTVSFRTGSDVAASTDANAGSPAAGIDGQTGTFTITAHNPNAPGFYSKGQLQYVGEHYRQFAQTKEWYIKAGPGSPENLFGYYHFDGTVDKGGSADDPQTNSNLHEWPKYVGDWNEGDPTWKDGKGKSLIGLLNYMASTGCNSVYFIPNSSLGDARDNWPWTDETNYDVYDVSKLAQWDIVLRHMDKLGLAKSYYMAEAENTDDLGNGTSTRRKIYYRELLARFNYQLGMCWSLSEETTLGDNESIKAMEIIASHDIYNHPIGTHTYPNSRDNHYSKHLDKTFITAIWGQIHNNFYNEVKKWVDRSKDNGRKMIVANDEAGWTGMGFDQGAVDIWWNTVMAGGEGYYPYFGYHRGNGDCDDEDWRSRGRLWETIGYGVKFFMSPQVNRHIGRDGGLEIANDLGNGNILANENVPADAAYIVLNDGGNLNMSKAVGDYQVHWFDIEDGGDLQQGSVTTVSGGQTNDLGNPPSNSDWVIIVAKEAVPVNDKSLQENRGTVRLSAVQAGDGRIRVNYHLPEAAEVSVELFSTSGERHAVLAKDQTMGAGSHTLTWKNTAVKSGQYIIRLRIQDGGKVLSRSSNLIIL